MPYGGNAVTFDQIAERMLILRTDTTQTLSDHDGTLATETVVDFGSGNNSIVSCVAGVFTLLKNTGALEVTAEIHGRKTGGTDDGLYTWIETSIDNGVSWTAVDQSLRHTVFSKDGDGIVVTDWSSKDFFPAGVQFRVIATADGIGMSIQKPDNIVTANAGAVGFSKKITIRAM